MFILKNGTYGEYFNKYINHIDLRFSRYISHMNLRLYLKYLEVYSDHKRNYASEQRKYT